MILCITVWGKERGKEKKEKVSKVNGSEGTSSMQGYDKNFMHVNMLQIIIV